MSKVQAPYTNLGITCECPMLDHGKWLPLSNRNNCYLLVVQDYFTKWPEPIPIPDQTAARITKEMDKLFCMYGIPDIVHSDQGWDFVSTIFRQTLEAFGIKKSHTTAYHPERDGMANV